MPLVVELNINSKTCGKWLPKYIIDILKKYPQTNFAEWDLLEIYHVDRPDAKVVNMISNCWHPVNDPWGRKCAIGHLPINPTLQSMEILLITEKIM